RRPEPLVPRVQLAPPAKMFALDQSPEQFVLLLQLFLIGTIARTRQLWVMTAEILLEAKRAEPVPRRGCLAYQANPVSRQRGRTTAMKRTRRGWATAIAVTSTGTQA